MVGQSMGQRPMAGAGWPWRLWVRWIGANALAEMVGLGSSALLWVLFFTGMEDALGVVMAAIVVVLGSTLLEGSAAGIAQWRVLRHPLPGLTLRAWWVATALGALVAWTLGMVPSTLMAVEGAGWGAQAANSAPSPEMDDALTYALAAVMGIVLGPVLASAQWWVLRRHVAHAWWWIPAHAVAWALGMPVIFVMVEFVPGPAQLLLTGVIVLAGLALAGAIVGAVHGLALLHLVRDAPRPARVLPNR